MRVHLAQRGLILFSVLSLSLASWGFDADFKIIHTQTPLEFQILFESLKVRLKDPAQQSRLKALCQGINTGLGSLTDYQMMFLLKSEVSKTFLEWSKSSRPLSVTDLTVKRLENIYQKNQLFYTDFSHWFIEALLSDLKNKNQLSTSLPFMSFWVEQLDTLSPQDFNQLTTEASWKVLERLRMKSQFTKKFVTSATKPTLTVIFNIPEAQKALQEGPASPNELNDMNQADPIEPSQTAKEESQKALEQVKNLKPKNAATPEEKSQVIDGLE
jgi:hypothetical protein